MKFKQKWRQFIDSKSNWLGITSIIGAIVGYLTHEMSPSVAVGALMAGLQIIFLKDAIAKGKV